MIGSMIKSRLRRLRYGVEAIVVWLLIKLFRSLSYKTASNLGGWIGRHVGPKLAVNRKAMRHITENLKLSKPEARQITLGMWENLGRIFAEYPHLREICYHHITLHNTQYLEALEGGRRPAIFFSGHLANWEIAGPAVLPLGIDVDLIYRAPNNPYVERILQSCRSLKGQTRTYPKSAQGMRQVVSALREKRNIGILIDQKYNQGVEAEFFGRPAMTSTAFIQLAKRFQCALIPARVVRREGTEFDVTLYQPLDLSLSDDILLKQAHDYLESWISENPEQWLWLHRRWKSSGARPL